MKIYAHRGSSHIWPENTVLAFEKAHGHGATGFEVDLRLSGDGEIVLSHDDNLARLGQPGITVSQSRCNQLLAVEVTSPDKKLAAKLTTLRQVLVAFPDKDYIFDCKITSEAMMVKLRSILDDLGFHDRIWFLTWSQRADRLVEELFPGYAYFPRENRIRPWGILSLAGLGALAEPHNPILALPPYSSGLPVFSRKQVGSVKRRGKVFLGYLVNSKRDYRRCRDTGIEHILTDRVDLVAQYISEEP